MHLILVRHAKAAPGSPDELRPLTGSGRRAASELGERLAPRRPDAVVSSPLRRARETAEAIAAAAGLEVVVDERLAPGATIDDVRELVQGRGGTIVAVGHQPDCSEIAQALTGEELAFPTAGFTELEL